jgi:hypothetical protein
MYAAAATQHGGDARDKRDKSGRDGYDEPGSKPAPPRW